jgi:nitrite reductase/ring-hydroxylating ferredoxin subunit
MERCEVCGNEYDKAFEVVMGGERHVFDSFECAIHALAPRCAHCGVKIAGHGVEADGTIYCCAHCAEQEGVSELQDRV